MSKDDTEKGRCLLNPYIEIGKGRNPNHYAWINVSTFKDCLEHLIPSFNAETGQTMFTDEEEEKLYSVYGTVGRTVLCPGFAYLNISEPPVSRTFMGFLLEDVLAKNLPRVHKCLMLEG
jgi:hypothetical protein